MIEIEADRNFAGTRDFLRSGVSDVLAAEIQRQPHAWPYEGQRYCFRYTNIALLSRAFMDKELISLSHLSKFVISKRKTRRGCLLAAPHSRS
jgi:hypothetical protein